MNQNESFTHFDTIAKAIAFIKDNYTHQPNLEEVAAHVHLSKFHLQRLFKKWAGISPKEFLQYTTLEQAKRALATGKSTLATAYEVGLSGNGRLHDLFVKIEACTPGEFRKRGTGIILQYATILTPFGMALVVETPRGICQLSFVDSEIEVAETLQQWRHFYTNAQFAAAWGENVIRLQQYFSDWQIPTQPIGLDLQGTPFQIQVWKALLQIPTAQLVAYQDIANRIEKPKAVRAVGTAIGKNPIAYLIPCHRVIKNSGVMGNYRWNSERKVAINGYEQVRLSL